ncbi:helix-turn-helix domain-containing protein [Limisalsivibrio acetivorans]|uniref:helix-turn-helix domain-containing protein n=1 Tax=Limisalsivibrio acetivorans TaxID=1304888 RepID=UPI0003B37808|nr:helix-turn-helix transcriptional regulator [Limisalsivibrio acetivorans]
MILEDYYKGYDKETKIDIQTDMVKLQVSTALKELMESKGYTKKILAEKMEVSPAYVTKIFGGDNISLKTIAKVAVALDIHMGIKLKNLDISSRKNNVVDIKYYYEDTDESHILDTEPEVECV